jgi:hypothetical protein
MKCEVCEAEEAAFTIIPTGPEGFPQSIGPACFARMGLEFAKTLLPAEEVATTLGPLFVTPARQRALAKDSKRVQAEEPTPEPEPEPEPEPAPGPPEEPATGTDG